MALKLYPLGIQTFERIRKEDKLYIDKTEYVYRLTHTSGTYFFLGRPRRFGKSLLLTTLQSYFEGKKDLFRGLAIEQMEKEWTEHPVLHFDLSGGKHMDKEQLERYLAFILETEEKKWGITQPQIDANNRLTELINTAYEKSGKQVVVLVDEYDAPMLDVAHEQEQLDSLRNIMRNFYSALKYSEAKLRFVFLTGITRFSQVSIFSELNNITNISMNDDYAGICGITKDELLTQMSEDIEALAKRQNITKEQVVDRLKENYDGYHFTRFSPDIFNPYSLLNCFAENKFGSYWFSSGTPTYLINMMRKYEVVPTDVITRVEADASEFDAPTENMPTIMPLLYQSGYITIKEYNEDYNYYVLDVPNKEVKIGLTKALIPSYVTQNTLATTNTARRIAQALDRQNMDKALTLLQTFLGTVPYCNNTNYEGHYQQMLYILFALLTNYDILVEQHTAKGRIDITLKTADTIYVMELKFNKSAEEALAQIEARHYADAFKMSGKKVVKVGLNFSVKDEVNTLEWVIS